MPRTRFTAEEAREKLHRRVKSLVGFAGVPQGTTGVVVGADEAGGGFDLLVEWEQADRLQPLRDWITKDEYEAGLVEV